MTPEVKITDEFLADLERKANAATEGKWFIENGNSGYGTRERLRVNTGRKYSDIIADYFLHYTDIEFIAAAQPANVLAMIAELRAVRLELEVNKLALKRAYKEIYT